MNVNHSDFTLMFAPCMFIKLQVCW